MSPGRCLAERRAERPELASLLLEILRGRRRDARQLLAAERAEALAALGTDPAEIEPRPERLLEEPPRLPVHLAAPPQDLELAAALRREVAAGPLHRHRAKREILHRLGEDFFPIPKKLQALDRLRRLLPPEPRDLLGGHSLAETLSGRRRTPERADVEKRFPFRRSKKPLFLAADPVEIARPGSPRHGAKPPAELSPDRRSPPLRPAPPPPRPKPPSGFAPGPPPPATPPRHRSPPGIQASQTRSGTSRASFSSSHRFLGSHLSMQSAQFRHPHSNP